ncbi:GNAT family N-acetyltransferase [Psychromicrobium xiongbiense]|uniref:GNAT family N-acetyltransferase n=1 Tax=Psychromicrobium xiongbiense TaxID=3051184 RepID=UPI00255284FF|nr:GNAT family N-acetyltransferase [Psychromicrobium sp. YIM S02556]
MSNNVTLIARTSPLQFETDITTRSITADDIPALGELYFKAYDSGIAERSVEEARAEIAEAFEGKFGKLLLDASQVVLDEGAIVAGAFVVERSPEEDTPEAPLLIELFTDRDHRRQGLAERLVLIASDRLFNSGYKSLAVSVNEENSAALALYLSIDFSRWENDN